MTAKAETRVLFDPNQWSYLMDSINASRWVVLSDSNTSNLCLPRFKANYFNQEEFLHLEVPAGEAHKSLPEAERILGKMMDAGIDRNAVLICLGGGMLTDLGGFVGSIYKRGIRTILVPTTLLSMTDAAIGGKNGVNFRSLKNQLGTIRDPEAVFIDPAFLETLSARELRSGFAETIKHALIADERFWREILHAEPKDLMRQASLIKRSIHIKQAIVAQDQGDHGVRQMLNFGHTIGHAIEALSQHTSEPLLHGECVALGMIGALELSVSECGFPEAKAAEAIEYLRALYHDVEVDFATDDLLEAMRHDKKNRKNEIVFSLLGDVADKKIGIAMEKSKISAALKGVLS